MFDQPVGRVFRRRRSAIGRLRGFTLLEMLVGLALMGVVVGGLLSVLIRQQRFNTRVSQTVGMRAALRHAFAGFPADLRGMSPASGDIYALDDKSIDFRAVRGTSIVCVIPLLAGPTLIVPPATLRRENGLTSWMETPVVGDSILIYTEGAGAGTDDDTWSRYAINAIAPMAGGCPPATGFTTVADVAPSYHLTVSANLDSTIAVGAPIRVFRRVRYELYATAGAWYLGYTECLSGGCSAIEPIAGPYRPYSVAGQSGMRLTYEDTLGAVATPATVARVNIVVRSQTPLRSDGTRGRDSLATVIGIRNRP